MPVYATTTYADAKGRNAAPSLLTAATVSLDYMRTMTDDTGMIQHGIGGIPDAATGYTADDNCRALLAMVRLWRTQPARRAEVEPLLRRYLQYMAWSQRKDGPNAGWFVNFVSYDRRYLDERGTEDCLGRCLWALGEATAGELPAGCTLAVHSLFYRALPLTLGLHSPRAIAYALLGLTRALPYDQEYVAPLTEKLANWYHLCATDGWQWPENYLTYDNARIPEALMRSGNALDRDDLRTMARNCANFLTEHSFNGDILEPIGCRGWWYKGGEKARFDQQTLEAGGYAEMYRLLGDEFHEKQSLAWYIGQNLHGIPVYDMATGGCFDALTEYGVNRNMGAESILSLLLAL